MTLPFPVDFASTLPQKNQRCVNFKESGTSQADCLLSARIAENDFKNMNQTMCRGACSNTVKVLNILPVWLKFLISYEEGGTSG